MTYFEDNPEIFAAIVAAIAILGGLLGSIIGAKIQANGGRDQAAAAREAARIAAEAQRVAALWNVRQLQVAEYIQGVREVRRLANLFYEQDANATGLEAQLCDARHALSLKLAEVDLTLPFGVVQAAYKVYECLEREVGIARDAGPAEYFLGIVSSQVFSEDPAESELARQAEEAVNELRAAPDTGDPRPRFPLVRVVVQTVRAATGATAEQAMAVVRYVSTGQYPAMRSENIQENAASMATLIMATRSVLRSEDDVIPPVPEQRRRRWRAGAGR
ncbi:hypothetical protein [Streptomyces hydrogenans]|uniref:hypothetical protein n=1 Tax=Streptomyces hydrogenans TaxID=1873719 RepID=UPI00381E0202